MSTPFLKNPADIRCALTAAALLLALLFSDTVLNAYMAATTAHPFAAGFCKFAVLATFGECLAQRMLRGRYLPEGFGLVPRAVIWGALAVCITVAFTIFSAGAPQLLAALGWDWAPRRAGRAAWGTQAGNSLCRQPDHEYHVRARAHGGAQDWGSASRGIRRTPGMSRT